MRTQLRLLDDDGRQRCDRVWPTLPTDVQRDVRELFADVLVALLAKSSKTEKADELSLEDLGDSSGS